MGKHLKTQISKRVRATIGSIVHLCTSAGSKSSGAMYFQLTDAIKTFRGAVNLLREADHFNKNIILRPSRRHPGLHVLYVLNKPRQWSQGCLDNRALQAKARRQAHDLEHDPVRALPWRVRFLSQYYHPDPEKKFYPHFYTFVYNAIYQSLREAAKNAETSIELTSATIRLLSSQPSVFSRHRGLVHTFQPLNSSRLGLRHILTPYTSFRARAA